MQQVAQIERERVNNSLYFIKHIFIFFLFQDDCKTQISTMKKQLQEAHEIQSKGDSKLNKVLQTLRNLQEEKGSLESKLSQKSIALNAQSEALQKKTEETQRMRDKIVSLELSLSSCNDEKTQNEDKIEKLKQNLMRLESDKRNLQEELTRIESRSTKLELQRMAAEGDLQRLQMMLQEKDGHIQKLQEKCETQNRALVSLEERCTSLKSTIDQLNLSLERASGTESESKAEIQQLQRSLLEVTSASHSAAEKLKHVSVKNTKSKKEIKINGKK